MIKIKTHISKNYYSKEKYERCIKVLKMLNETIDHLYDFDDEYYIECFDNDVYTSEKIKELGLDFNEIANKLEFMRLYLFNSMACWEHIIKVLDKEKQNHTS